MEPACWHAGQVLGWVGWRCGGRCGERPFRAATRAGSLQVVLQPPACDVHTYVSAGSRCGSAPWWRLGLSIRGMGLRGRAEGRHLLEGKSAYCMGCTAGLRPMG